MKLLRRVLGVLGRATLFVVITLLVAEVALQIASRFAHSRATGWRADAAHRILCVGDSHTYGVLVPPEESYPGHLQRLLDEQAPGAYSVVNLGLPGLNTSQVRERLHAALAVNHPETVIVWCGVNDAWNRGESTEGHGWRARLSGLVLESRLVRLVRVWRHDRRLDRMAAALGGSSGQQRYEIETQSDAAAAHQHYTIITERGVEQITLDSSGMRVDDDMERLAAEDYLAMVAEARASGAKIVFITYPVEKGAFAVANHAMRRVAKAEGVPVVESGPATSRLPMEQRELLWAAHPNGPMYREIALDVVPIVTVPVTRLTYVAHPPGGPNLTGSCAATTDNCAPATGCYRWNPHGTVCSVAQELLHHASAVRASARLRAARLPSDWQDVLAVYETTYATGAFVQLTDTGQLRLLSIGGKSAQEVCGPLPSRVVPDTWYGIRLRAEKLDAATVALELLSATGEVLDSMQCTNQPTGGGAFTHVRVGNTNPAGSTADVEFSDVEVFGDAD